MYNRKVIGSRIRKIRNEKGISQERLAELTSVSTNYIGIVERGEKSVTIDVLEKIASALDTTFAELLSYSEPLAKNDSPEIVIEIVDKIAGQPYDVQQDVLKIVEIYLAGIDRYK